MVETMKPSGIEGFFDIPADWEVNKMAYVFSFGKGLSITKEDLQDEGIPAISYGDIHSRFGFEIDPAINELRCVDPKYIRSSPSALLHFGDFVFADTSEDVAGSGNFTHLNSTMTTFASYHTITARAKRELDCRYMAYLFDSEPFRTQIRNRVSGVKVFSITQQILKSAKLLLPPLNEQKAIAALLDDRCGQVDSIVADLERQVEILQQYKKSLITETVTKGLDKSVPMKDSGIDWMGKIPAHWEVKRLKYVMNNHDSKRKPIEASERSQSGDVLYDYYGASGVVDKIDDYIFDMTAILIGEDGANLVLRNLPLIYIASGKYWVNNHAHILTPKVGHDLWYMAHLMEIIDYKDFITGSAQPKLSQEKLNNVLLITPPESEQCQIGQFLNTKCAEVDAIIAEKQRAAETMRQYKKSLIYEYVTGKKRVAF